ncbi:MAG: radical SAM protein [Lachnospiraceae bacterium]|nr:radical SAM protein [Lachnospiraceae bacterium]MDD5853435.1 radical SAM protein [Lachnospiraceae bacterium]
MKIYSELEKQTYSHCMLCPRKCGADRLNEQYGVCHMKAESVVARAALHFYEEPCISGEQGSGAVFFSGCNLRCVFCQNYEISRGKAGLIIDTGRLAEIFLELQDKKANNINLVTGVMFIPTIVEALKQAKAQGLHIPVIYNSSGYESVEALRLLEGWVDVYLPDFKCMSQELGTKYFGAPDYAEAAEAAIQEMVRQAPHIVLDEQGFIRQGVIVRHLVLPGQRKEAEKVLGYLHDRYGDQIYLSIMNQYTPMKGIDLPDRELKRKLTTYEYQKVIDYALSIGITKAYMQVGKTADESFVPPFDLEGVEK